MRAKTVTKEVTKVFVIRRRKGVSIAETAASMVLLIPLLFLVLYVVLEASKAYFIKESLAQGARQAARDIAIIYGTNPRIEGDRYMQDSMVYSTIKISGAIADEKQFEEAQFDSNANPPTVTVTVNYTSGQNGLPTFPNPDPLHLGNNFKLSATSTYRLE